MNRRHFMRAGALLALGGPAIVATGCANGSFMSPLTVSSTKIEPNGTSIHNESDVYFRLTRRALVSAQIIGPDGKQYVIRKPQMRAPDQYEIRFRGTVSVPGTDWLRVLPDGSYKLTIQAKDTAGQVITRSSELKIANADTTPPQITKVYVEPKTFSPNGDGINDTVRVSYQLTKKAEVRIYATNATGGFFLIQAPKETVASLQSFQWDGTAGGGAVLPDGKYEFHIEATDAAGNFTDYVTNVTIHNGGIPRAVITNVRISPTAIPLGGILNVSITVKNTGTAPLRTLGPPPGTKYTTNMNFSSFKDPKDPAKSLYYERPGVWRVGVSWQNASQPYPVRWGFFKDLTRELMPGETVTVDGSVQVLDTTQHQQVFYAGLIQEGVGYPGGQVGQTPITISF